MDDALMNGYADYDSGENTGAPTGEINVVSVDELTILFGELEPGIYRYAGRVGNTGLLRWAQARGWCAWQINGTTIADKAAFLAALARAMQLPAWFGRNWDALDESLRDLAGQRAEGYLLIYDYPAPLAEGDPAAWRMALDILRDASDFWQQQGQLFYVLLRHTRGIAPEIPLLR